MRQLRRRVALPVMCCAAFAAGLESCDSNVLLECDIVLYAPRMRIIECVASSCFGFSFRDVTPIF